MTPPSAVAAARAALAALLFAAPAEPPGPADGEAVTFPGRVIDAETKLPVAGAKLVVKLSLNGVAIEDEPEWARPRTLTTDASGRFTVDFPPERPGEAVYLEFPRVDRDGYAPVSFPNPISRVSLLQARKYGDVPFFDTVELHKGKEYRGQLVYPSGDPAAGVPLNFFGSNWNYPEHGRLRYVTEGTTDDSGQFAVTLPLSQALSLTARPPRGRFAGFNWNQQFKADALESGDLGVLPIPPGWRIPGRMIDREGRPVAGQTVTLLNQNNNNVTLSAVTDADGRFSFPMTTTGHGFVYGQGQIPNRPASGFARPSEGAGLVVEPVYLSSPNPAGPPRTVILRELPTVAVSVRFVDPEGKPARGGPVMITGMIPTPASDPDAIAQRAVQSLWQPPAAPDPAPFFAPRPNVALFVNPPGATAPAQLQWFGGVNWSAVETPGADGRVVVRAPKPLINAYLYASPPNETTAYVFRRSSGEPVESSSTGVFLNDLDADLPDLEIVVKRAPVALIDVRSETGDLILPENLSAVTSGPRGQYQANVARQADGRYRSQGLVPDTPYELTAWLNGYIQNAPELLTMAEGEERRLTLVLRTRPTPPKAGDPAPPYLLKTNDGRVVSPETTRGTFVLLHTWDQNQGLPPLGAKAFDEVHERFGKDGRVLVVGVRIDHPLTDQAQTKVSTNRGVRKGAVRRPTAPEEFPYPWTKLRQGYSEPFLVDFGMGQNQVILIGPDGKVVERDLNYNNVPQTVENALKKE